MTKVSASLIDFFSLVPTLLLRGFVLTKLWRWFIVDTFHVAPLTVGVAIGLSILFSLMNPINFQLSEPIKVDTDKEFVNGAIFRFSARTFGPLGALLFGWVVTWFM